MNKLKSSNEAALERTKEEEDNLKKQFGEEAEGVAHQLQAAEQGEETLKQEEETAKAVAGAALKKYIPAGKIAKGLGKKTLSAGKLAGGATIGAGMAAGTLAAKEIGASLMPGIWIILSLLLYASDAFLTGFHGTDFNVLLVRFSSLGQDGVIRAVAFVAIVVLIYIALLKTGKGEGEIKSAVFLGAAIAAVFILGDFSVGWFHIIFAFLLYLMLARNVAKQQGTPMYSVNMTFALLLILDFFVFGFISWILGTGPNGIIGQLNVPFGLTNRFLFPIWFFYTLALTMNYKKSKLINILSIVVVLVILFSWIGDMSVINNYSQGIPIGVAEQSRSAIEKYSQGYGNLIKFGQQAIIPLSCITDLGDYEQYQACIRRKQIEINPELNESNIKSSLDKKIKGITKVEFVKSSRFPSVIQKEFTPKLPVDYILDIDAPKTIKMKLSCKFKSYKDEIAGTVGPKETVDRLEKNGIAGTAKELIFCTPLRDYAPKKYTVTFEAEIFDLETSSWLNRLFAGPDMTEQRKTQLKILYELKDTASETGNEFAAFSFNFGKPSAPGEPFSSILDNSPMQAFEGAIENMGKGKITSINYIDIDLIDSISSPTKGCTSLFEKRGNKLVLKDSAAEKLVNLDIKQGKTLPLIKGCFFTISNELRDPKQTGHEYFIKEFKAVLGYSYKIQAEEKFEVKSNKALAGLT